jgi:hypothetical protein
MSSLIDLDDLIIESLLDAYNNVRVNHVCSGNLGQMDYRVVVQEINSRLGRHGAQAIANSSYKSNIENMKIKYQVKLNKSKSDNASKKC